MMLGAVLQITNVFGNPFLHDFARNPEFADSFVVKYPVHFYCQFSQMAEVGFHSDDTVLFEAFRY